MQNISSVKVTGIAWFLIAVVGLIFALYPIQDWKMPQALAVLLLTILFGALILSLGLLISIGIKALRQFRENRSTSASWITNVPSGLLDCKVEGARARDRFDKEWDKLHRNIIGLSEQVRQHEREVKDLLKSNKNIKANSKQRKVNRIGNKLNGNAIYIEKELSYLTT